MLKKGYTASRLGMTMTIFCPKYYRKLNTTTSNNTCITNAEVAISQV